ncbi:MAG: ribonuclease III domain-containing protein [Leptolyngbyaceae cyanobacterium MO_188.B28]|nr:ribonuclease III domain-containing protein [Leptolyngbyaceae cyanobacterium MO_188.B28]
MALSDPQIQSLSPSALAYIGDAVYELYVRTAYLFPPRRSQTYHHLVVEHVKAERQAKHLQTLIPYLTDGELEVIRRGRNAALRKNRRVEPSVYQQASSFETLIGHLYVADSHRLWQLLGHLRLGSTPENLP